MKILYLNPTGQIGGAEASLLDILASMRAGQPDWSLHLLAGDDGPLHSRAEALGVSSTVMPLPLALAEIGDAGAGGPAGKHVSKAKLLYQLLKSAPATAKYLRQLRLFMRALSPDVVHSNGFKMHVLSACAKTRSMPLVWHIHDYLKPRPVMAKLMRHLSGRCALAIANSESVAEDLRSTCGARLAVQTIYNCIDVEKFSPAGASLDLDALSGLQPSLPETIKVGMLSTLARWKGQETFLHALSLLPKDLSFRGYIVGGALYRTGGSQYTLEELREIAERLGLAQKVGFTGFVDNPASAIRALDIVVHASTQPEPFGLAIAEGMACGRAVIASQAGGAAEIFEAEVNALGHPPGDSARLAERIMWLATNRDLRARLGVTGRATAELRFNRARLATELIPIYLNITERQRQLTAEP